MANIKILKRDVVLPKTDVHVYTVAAPVVNRESILTLSKQFKFRGSEQVGVFQSDKSTLAYSEGHLGIRQCLFSGGLRYRDATLWQADDGKSAVKLADDAASKIALAYVGNTKLVQANSSKVVKVTHLTVASMQKDTKTADTRVIDSGVVLQRLIDGIPVEGPGGKAMVYIDANEKISGYDHYWRNLGKVQSTIPVAKLLPVAAAEEDLKRHWANASFDIEVSEIRFGYFEAGWGESQAFIQPAYIMPLTLISGDGRIKAGSFHIFSAVANPPAVIMPPAPKVVAQEPRK